MEYQLRGQNFIVQLTFEQYSLNCMDSLMCGSFSINIWWPSLCTSRFCSLIFEQPRIENSVFSILICIRTPQIQRATMHIVLYHVT